MVRLVLIPMLLAVVYAQKDAPTNTEMPTPALPGNVGTVPGVQETTIAPVDTTVVLMNMTTSGNSSMTTNTEKPGNATVIMTTESSGNFTTTRTPSSAVAVASFSAATMCILSILVVS